MPTLKDRLTARALEEGFSKLGICAPDAAPETATRLRAFLEVGYHGQMAWMADREHWRGNAAALWPEARSVIMLAEVYTPETDPRAVLDQRRWLAGDVMTLADLTAAAHLSCLDYISDVDWNRSATVKDWYAKIKSRPSFRTTLLADHVPGFPPPAHYADLDF